jgi:hypothetical protein
MWYGLIAHPNLLKYGLHLVKGDGNFRAGKKAVIFNFGDIFGAS